MPINPDAIPVLEASQICRFVRNKDDGRHCLYGWLETLPMPRARLGMLHTLQDACNKRVGHSAFMTANDHDWTSAESAAVWNEARAALLAEQETKP